jgi:hypothetical protein
MGRRSPHVGERHASVERASEGGGAHRGPRNVGICQIGLRLAPAVEPLRSEREAIAK